VHPDTGELTITPFCFAAYTPMQPPIIVGLLWQARQRDIIAPGWPYTAYRAVGTTLYNASSGFGRY
jgi:hypothetical protein